MKELFRFLALLQARMGVRIFGIGYAARMLARCHPGLIASLLRHFGARVGEKAHFKSPLFLDNFETDQDATGDFSRLSIANNCYVGSGVFFDLTDDIIIQEDCAIGPGVRFITHEDLGGRPLSGKYPRKKAPIRVGAGTWIGAGAILLQGVELGPCCVVAAGAVVRDSFPEHSVVAGVPAKLV
jgi:acetyltransferase-like isoleucine patch superfamily enzyme